jgi:hypothetical protein
MAVQTAAERESANRGCWHCTSLFFATAVGLLFGSLVSVLRQSASDARCSLLLSTVNERGPLFEMWETFFVILGTTILCLPCCVSLSRLALSVASCLLFCVNSLSNLSRIETAYGRYSIYFSQ